MKPSIVFCLGLGILSLSACNAPSIDHIEKNQIPDSLSINNVSFVREDVFAAYSGSDEYIPESYFVTLVFSDSGQNKFQALQSGKIGKPITIKLDDNVIAAPILQEKITGKEIRISGGFTKDEAHKIAERLSPNRN